VFVEDSGNHNMWLTLLRAVLPPGMKLASVNLLGGHNKVVEACRLDQGHTGRPKLYIIDGNFDHVLGIAKPRLLYLYRLRAYCLENLLIHESAVIAIGLAWQPKKTEAQLSARFDFKGWKRRTVQRLLPLFVAYGIARKLEPSIQTVGYPVQRLFIDTPDGPEVCPRKARSRIWEVMRAVKAAVGLGALRAAKQDIRLRVRRISEEQAISGKDYLLPLLHLRLCKVFGFKGGHEQLKVALAAAWDRHREPWLARRIDALTP
jgi:hypothetical protein